MIYRFNIMDDWYKILGKLEGLQTLQEVNVGDIHFLKEKVDFLVEKINKFNKQIKVEVKYSDLSNSTYTYNDSDAFIDGFDGDIDAWNHNSQ